MSRYDDRYYDRRYDRQGKAGWVFLLVILAFAAYLGINSGWLNMNTIKAVLPSSKSVPLCSETGGVMPCIMSEVPDNAQQTAPVSTVPDSSRLLTFVDESGSPVSGIKVKHWVGDMLLESTTDANGQVRIFPGGDECDPNDPHNYVFWAGWSGTACGRDVLAVK